nr:helix-turn-helix transcriptional regulator [Thalassococcus arenae]
MFSALLAVQLACAFFFVYDIAFSVLGLRTQPLSWALYELVELGAAAGLVLGVVTTSMMLRRSLRARDRAEQSLRAASGAFLDVLEERFDDWGLTPAERDVALFAVKGLSIAEIAALRSTSEGTVKAQTNAIYRKAGVSGRPQLLSLFIDDLMDAAHVPARRSA